MLSPSSRIALIFSWRSAASFILPISLLTALRSAFLASTSRMSVLRNSSCARIWSTTAPSMWRLRSESRINSGCSRINFKSSILHLLVRWKAVPACLGYILPTEPVGCQSQLVMRLFGASGCRQDFCKTAIICHHEKVDNPLPLPHHSALPGSPTGG